MSTPIATRAPQAVAFVRFRLAGDYDAAAAVLVDLRTGYDYALILRDLAELVGLVVAHQVQPDDLDDWLGRLSTALALHECQPPGQG